MQNTNSHTTARRQLKQKGTYAYKLQTSLNEKAVFDGHGSHIALKLGVKAKENQDKPLHYPGILSFILSILVLVRQQNFLNFKTSCLTAIKRHAIK